MQEMPPSEPAAICEPSQHGLTGLIDESGDVYFLTAEDMAKQDSGSMPQDFRLDSCGRPAVEQAGEGDLRKPKPPAIYFDTNPEKYEVRTTLYHSGGRWVEIAPKSPLPCAAPSEDERHAREAAWTVSHSGTPQEASWMLRFHWTRAWGIEFYSESIELMYVVAFCTLDEAHVAAQSLLQRPLTLEGYRKVRMPDRAPK